MHPNGPPELLQLQHAEPLRVSTTPKQSHADVKVQKTFEKEILSGIAKQTSDILMYGSLIVCYKNENDTSIMVVGSADENEVLLYNILLALRDSLHFLFK